MTADRPRRAKIVCTLGPASADAATIERLMLAGMDVARLNFSHGDYASQQRLLDTVRATAHRLGRTVAVIQDLQGPKIRVGQLPGGGIQLVAGQTFTLTATPAVSEIARVSVSYLDFAQDVRPGDPVLLDDGQIQLRVIDVRGADVRCEVRVGGRLTDRKGLNLPGSTLSVAALTAKDHEDLAFGARAGVDWIAMSFVQRPDDILQLRSALAALGATTPIIAKIEKPQAVACLDAILGVVDGVMVARGDLGVEVPAEEVPGIQKRIIAACNRRGIPVITATQMLESMIHNPRPTRAEASDVANAVLDGTDAVMLSAETASGRFPTEAVQTMARIVMIAERDAPRRWDLQRRDGSEPYDVALAIGYAACLAADILAVRAIVCLTQSGTSARMAARFRPQVDIISLSSNAATCRQLALVWGVNPVLSRDFGDNLDATIAMLIEELRDARLIDAGDRAVFTSGQPFSARCPTNTLRIEDVPGGVGGAGSGAPAGAPRGDTPGP